MAKLGFAIRCLAMFSLVASGVVLVAIVPACAQQPTESGVLRGHLAPVLMGVFTPDDLRAVTASSDDTARLWDLQTFSEVRQYKGHTGPLYCLALSANGRTLVTGAQDNTLRLWDVPQTRPLVWLPGHPGGASNLALSADGRQVVSVGIDKAPRVWEATKLPPFNVSSPQPVDLSPFSKPLAAQEFPGTAVAYRGDGNLFATADDHGRIAFWSPYLDEAQGQVESSQVTSLAFHSNNQQVFASGADGLIRQWQLPIPLPRQIAGIAGPILHLEVMNNQPIAIVVTSDQITRVINLDTGQVVREIAKREKPITAIRLSPNNAVLAIGDDGGRVALVNMTNGEEQGTLSGHAGSIQSIQFHADNQQLFTTSVDGAIRHWRLPIANVPIAGHAEPIQVLASSQSGQWYVTGSTDKCCRVWQPNGQPLRALGNHQKAITALAVRHDDSQIASGDAEGIIWLWNGSNGTPEGSFAGPATSTTALAYDRNGTSLLSGDDQGWIRRWQLPAKAPLLASGHSQAVRAVATSPNGQTIISGSLDQTVRVWNAENGQAIRTLDAPGGLGGPISSVAVSPDGTRVAAVSDSGQLAIWNLADGALQQLRTGTGGAMRDVAFLPSGLQVITLEADSAVRFWQVPLAPTTVPEEAIPYQAIKLAEAGSKSLTLSPDGKWLFVAGAAKVVHGWQLVDGKVAADAPFHSFAIAQASITDLAFSRNGQRLAAACEDRNVYVWDAAAIATAPANQNVPPIQTLTHAAAIRSVSISDDSARIATAGDDFMVYQWDAATGQIAERFLGHTQPVSSVCMIGNTQRIASGSQDNALRIWTPSVMQVIRASNPNAIDPVTHLAATVGDVSFAALLKTGQSVLRWRGDGTPMPAVTPPIAALQSLRASADGTRVVAGSSQGKVFVWTVADGGLVATVDAPGNVADAALNRVGNEVAVADTQNRVRIFSVTTPRLLEEIATPQPVTSVQWSSDEQQCVTTGSAAMGFIASRALRSFIGNLPEGISRLALTPDGTRILLGSVDGKLRQVLVSNGTVERTLEGHTDAITDLSISANGQQFASVGRDKALRIWNAVDGSLLHKVDHATAVLSVTHSPNSQRIATCSEDGIVRVFDAAAGLPLENFSGHMPGVGQARWLSDSVTVVSGSSDQTLRVRKSAVVRSYRAHVNPVVDMSLFAGGAQSLSCSADGRVVLCDTSSGQMIREFQGASGEPRAVAARVDNQRIALGTSNGQVLVWNAINGELLQTLSVDGPVRSVAWSGENAKLAVSTETNKLYIFGPPLPPASPQPGNELTLHQQTNTESIATRILFDRDNRTVWASHASGHLARWAYAAPTQIVQFNHGGPVYGVTTSRDAKTIYSCSADQTVRVWDVTTGQQKFQLNGHQGPVHALALSPDESFVVSSGADRTLRLWDVVGGRQLKQLATLNDTMYSVAVHPNGQLVAAAGADRKVYLIDLISGAIIRTLEGHQDFIHCVAFNASGTRLLSYGYAGQLRIWDPATGNPLLQERIGRIGNYAEYNSDGSRLLISNGDATARIFDIPPAAR